MTKYQNILIPNAGMSLRAALFSSLTGSIYSVTFLLWYILHAESVNNFKVINSFLKWQDFTSPQMS